MPMFPRGWNSPSAWLTLPEPEISAELNRMNMRRIFRMAALLIPLHAIHLILFFFKSEVSAEGQTWRTSIIFSHALMIPLVAVFFILTRPRRTENTKLSLWLPYAGVLLYLSFGAVVASIDQLVTPAITPLLISAVGLGVTILLHPRKSLPLFVWQYGLFAFLVSYFQKSPEKLLSAHVNALTVGFLGFGLNWILYSARIRELRQVRTIEQQKHDLAIRNRALRRILSGKDRFFSIIAHDLRGPIGGISDGLGIVNDEYDQMDDGERRALLRSLSRAAERSQLLLEDLLHWARSQSGQLPFRPEPFNISILGREALLLVEERARRKSIQVKLQIPDDLTVLADRSMIHSVISNLLGNAIKFTPRGGQILLSASSQSECKDGNIEISVTDNGIGISSEAIRHITRGDGITATHGTEGETGTGLGLVLTRQFVEKNGGTLVAEQPQQGGSRFSFTLPASSVSYD